MTLEAYQQTASALGIDRGQFDRGFFADAHVTRGKEDAIDWDTSRRPTPPPVEIPEHLTVKPGRLIASLKARGESWETIARKMGLRPSYVCAMVSRSKRDRIAAATMERFKALLTPEERGML